MATSSLYYDPAETVGFFDLGKLRALVKTKRKYLGVITTWLDKQDAYTLSRPVRKRFARKPYSVNNLMDVWECDPLDIRALGKFNDKYVYKLSAIDVFSKFLHLVPLRSKTDTAVVSSYKSILKDPIYSRRRPIWLRTEKGKEFLNRHIKDTLKYEGIQAQLCKKPDVKCSVDE